MTHAAEDTSLCAEVLELLRHHHPDGADEGDPEATPPDRIGPFRILGMLGRGGMGVVYRAQRDDGEVVALKVQDGGILSARFSSRFRREAETLRRLDHPGIARFLEAGTYDSVVGVRPYCAMELVEGVSLRERARDRSWDDRARIALLADLAEALHHAHEHGIVHRDLKPENVMVTAEGKPKVLDFGVARVTAGELHAASLATGTGVLLGTIRYMSPEQAQGLTDEIDRRSDVYALGVLGYELLAGELPYELHTRSVTRALVQVATTPSRPLGDVRPALRGPIERVLARALAKRAADRFATAAELAEELRRHLAGLRVRTRGPGMLVRGFRFSRRHPVVPGLLALVAIALGAVAIAPRIAPSSAAADEATALACAYLDSVDTRLHHGPRTPESIERCLALIGMARKELRRFGSRPYAADLRRYCAWREGEAHFFRASLTSDPDEFLRAVDAWSAAREPARPMPQALELPDNTVPIHPRITQIWPHHPDAAISLAYAEAGRERLPVRNYRLAVQHARRAWDLFARNEGSDAEPLGPTGWTGYPGIQARILNELGFATGAVGYYGEEPALIAEGLALLQRAESTGGLDDDFPAAASVQHNLGQVWLWEGRLAGRPASLDSAITHLERALAIRTVIPGNTSGVATRIALAEAFRSRARLDSLPADRARWIDRAGRVLAGLSPTPPAGHPLEARLVITRAAVIVDAAVLSRTVDPLVTAESLLAVVREDFPRGRYPVAFARMERESGRIEAARWLLTGSAAARQTGLARFSSAAEVLTEGQHRPFRRLADRALQSLTQPPPASPALTHPALMP